MVLTAASWGLGPNPESNPTMQAPGSVTKNKGKYLVELEKLMIGTNPSEEE
jgi:hypothetical protein